LPAGQQRQRMPDLDTGPQHRCAGIGQFLADHPRGLQPSVVWVGGMRISTTTRLGVLGDHHPSPSRSFLVSLVRVETPQGLADHLAHRRASAPHHVVCAPEAGVSGGLTRRMVVASGLLALLSSAAFAVLLVG
jgi:hypothetical protein